MAAYAKVTEEGMAQLGEMFFRLLETDRTSSEFEALFREVDRALGRVVAWEERECEAPLSSAQPAVGRG